MLRIRIRNAITATKTAITKIPIHIVALLWSPVVGTPVAGFVGVDGLLGVGVIVLTGFHLAM